jgi:ubiquinone/menaquinone biosynthesis C-methylase UbiE
MALTTLLQKLRRRSKPNEQKNAPAPAANVAVATANLRASYQETMSRFLTAYDRDSAMSEIVGGQYETMGEALRQIVEKHGLKDGDYLIDVGCGSGRLASALSRSKFRDTIRYLGIDIVPEMLEFAAEKSQQPAWRFELVLEPKIPETDRTADMVFFASVFTHLLQEESFLYLREAKRVLKPGGKILASYLDINTPKHWEIFETNVNSATARQSVPMSIFLSEDFFEVWAGKLDLEILENKPPEGGGQRLCILRKR